jgi:hypothetical protein
MKVPMIAPHQAVTAGEGIEAMEQTAYRGS